MSRHIIRKNEIKYTMIPTFEYKNCKQTNTIESKYIYRNINYVTTIKYITQFEYFISFGFFIDCTSLI